MLNKEIENLLNCDNCKLKECIGCEISYTDRKKIRQYIEQLENKVKQLGKGQHTLMQSRKKWKNRYYNADKKRLIKELETALDFARTGDDIISKTQVSCLENVLKLVKGEKE